IRTSWTNQNPGRRFYACLIPGSQCPLNDWVDPSICPRASAIILGLLKGMNALEQRLRQVAQDRARIRKYLYLSWLGFVVFVWVSKLA
nr:zinc finger, GRF-type [Tanacetum cinerariifolium]